MIFHYNINLLYNMSCKQLTHTQARNKYKAAF